MYFYLKISALVAWLGLAGYDQYCIYVASTSREDKLSFYSDKPWFGRSKSRGSTGLQALENIDWGTLRTNRSAKPSVAWSWIKTIVFFPAKILLWVVTFFVATPLLGCCVGIAGMPGKKGKKGFPGLIENVEEAKANPRKEDRWTPVVRNVGMLATVTAAASWVYYTTYRFFFSTGKPEVQIVEVEPERTVGEQWNNVLSNTWEKPKEFLGSTTGKVVAGTAAVAAVAGGYALVKALRSGKAKKPDVTGESSEEKTTSKRSSKPKQTSVEISPGYWAYGLVALGALLLLAVLYFCIFDGNTEPKRAPDIENGLLR